MEDKEIYICFKLPDDLETVLKGYKKIHNPKLSTAELTDPFIEELHSISRDNLKPNDISKALGEIWKRVFEASKENPEKVFNINLEIASHFYYFLKKEKDLVIKSGISRVLITVLMKDEEFLSLKAKFEKEREKEWLDKITRLEKRNKELEEALKRESQNGFGLVPYHNPIEKFIQTDFKKAKYTVALGENKKILKGPDFSMFLEDFNQNEKIKPSTKKLFFLILERISAENPHANFNDKTPKISSTSVYIDREEYFAILGKDTSEDAKKKASKQFWEDAGVLRKVSITLEDPLDKENLGEVSLISSRGRSRKHFTIGFDPGLLSVLLRLPFTAIPHWIYRLDERNENLVPVSRKLVAHYTMDRNIKSGTNDIISVESLLSSFQSLPSYEEVKETRQHRLRIIDPFERTLNHLEEQGYITWEYTHGRINGKEQKISEEEYEKEQKKGLSYDEFIGRKIKFTIRDYDIEKHRERIALKEEETKKKRQQKKQKSKKD